MSIKSFVLVFLPGIFIAACSNQSNGEKEIIRKVKVEKVNQASELLQKDFSGVIEETREVKLAFRVAGPIKSIRVKEGSYIREGELIAEIDPRDYQIQVDVALAQYNQVTAETERVKELYNRKSVSDKDYEKAISGGKLITAQLEHAKDQLRDTKLYAPFSGYIQEINFEKGEMINAGMPFASLIDLNKYRIEVDIPSSLFIKKDKFVSFSCKSFETGSDELPLKLISYNVKANTNQLYKLFFQLDPKLNRELKPGMSMQVFIYYKNPVDASLFVPLDAVFYEGGKSFVWVYNETDSTISRKLVVINGIISDGNVRIEEGLSGNEMIVVAGVHVLKENQKVEVIGPVSETNIGGLL